MKKKLISIMLAAVLLLPAVATVAADNDSVEISFKVGESILNINGVATEVETPYVVGDGTTLVPLRVITEAFGTQVDWENETQTITLTYPNVNITLQIGNIVASVNSHNETLLAAPVLSPNDVTMVPLRFISETFGADVSYDDNTEAILVTKHAIADGATVVGMTDLTRTGDSYYNWSIDTPTEMQMTDRRPDGLDTSFTGDDGSEFSISIYSINENTPSFDESYASVKDSFSSYTLVNAEKLTDAGGNKYMHFQGKDKNEFIDYREYYTSKYQYCLFSSIDIEADEKAKNMVLSIADSFKIGSIDNQTYNLSTVHTVEGKQYRTISDEDYKVTFDVPANYTMNSANGENEFDFFNSEKDSHAYVALGIYSKTDTVTAKLLAESDREIRKGFTNPDLVTLSDVIAAGDGSYRYTQTISGSVGKDGYTIDTFFEKGDYVYNFAIVQDGKGDEKEAQYILSSIKTEVLDSAKIGKILRNDSDDTDVTIKVEDYKFTLPAAWKLEASSAAEVLCMHDKTGSGMIVSVVKGQDFKRDGVSSVASDLRDYIMSNAENAVMVENLKYTTINGRKFAYFTYKSTSKTSVSYTTVYLLCENGKAVLFNMLQTDIAYQSREVDMFMNAISSFTKQ